MSGDATGPRDRTGWAFAAFVVLLHVLVFDAVPGAPDETQRWELAERLASHGPFGLWNSTSTSRYPPLLSMVAAIPIALGRLLDGITGGPWAARLGFGVSALAAALACLVFRGFVRRHVTDAGRADRIAIVFALTSPLLPYSKRFFSESLTALLVLVVVVAAIDVLTGVRERFGVLGSIALVSLPLNNLVLPPLLVVALVGVAWIEGRRAFGRSVLRAAAIGIALTLVTMLVRGGGRFDGGYSGERFTFGTLQGLAGLLFGPGRSVFLFAPMLVLGVAGWVRVRSTARGAALVIGGFAAASLLAIASWWCWWGGICWGPRLLVPVLPAVTLGVVFVAESAWWRRGAVPVLLAGLYVQGLGVAFKHDYDVYFWMRPDGKDEWRAWFDPSKSVLVRMPRHFVEHPWDVSSVFLQRRPAGASRVEVDGRPVQRLRVTHRGDALVSWWSVSEARLVRTDGGEETGAEWTWRASTHASEAARAGDGDTGTRWTTGRKRKDGDFLELDLGRTRTDVARVEFAHLPSVDDFPNALEAVAWASADDHGPGTPLPAVAATPSLVVDPAASVVAAGCLAALVPLLRRRRSEVAA